MKSLESYPASAEDKAQLSYKEAEAALKQMADSFLHAIPLVGRFLGKPEPSKANVEASSAEESRFSGSILIDENEEIVSLDQKAQKYFGYESNEIVGKPVKRMIPEFDKSTLTQLKKGQRKNGEEIIFKFQISELELQNQKLFSISVFDCQAQNGNSASSDLTEARYKSLVEQIPAVTFMASLAAGNHEIYVSPQIEGLLGFSPAEWISDPIRWYYQIHPDDRAKVSSAFAKTCLTGGAFRTEMRVLSKEGRVLWVHCEARMFRDNFGTPLFLQGIGFDITEIKEAEEKVRASLKEKEVLLKEVHHRVKNNLQVISSLLKLQGGKIKDSEALQAFVESENRVRAMAMIHEKLYNSRDLAHIGFDGYIRDLSTFLIRSYSARSKQIQLKLDIENVALNIDVAVPCGLIINELISNCFKHAFPSGRDGQIFVSFKKIKNNCVLLVSDNGIGVDDPHQPTSSSSLGLQLVKGLTLQLKGQLKIENGKPGLAISVSFPCGGS